MWASVFGLDDQCLYVSFMRDVIGNWRSTNFAEEITRLLQETEEPTTFFIAIGLSHVIRSRIGTGFTDVVEQLELVGFTVTPLY